MKFNSTCELIRYKKLHVYFNLKGVLSKKIMKEIGLPEVRFHDMRHTFAVISLQNGDDIKTVQANVGHSTAAFTLDVYGHVSQRMQKESANRMQSYINELKSTS